MDVNFWNQAVHSTHSTHSAHRRLSTSVVAFLLGLSLASCNQPTPVVDNDHDGLSDEWEASPEGQALGAKVGRKDAFFQFDWTYCTKGNNFDPQNVFESEFDSGNKPRFGQDEVKYLIGLYRDRLDESWCVHVDNGETVFDCDDLSVDGTELKFNQERKALAKARSVGPIPTKAVSAVAQLPGLDFPTLTFNETELYHFYFPPERVRKFHYALIGCYGGGQATYNDPMVQVGNNGKALAHEFGHKFGLGHGGGDTINHKPNYPSIMNYSVSYSVDGYSRSKYPTLNEFDVCEEKGLGIELSGEKVSVDDWAIGKKFEIPKELFYLTQGGVAPRSIGLNGEIDWNGDGAISTCDVNSSGAIRESNLEFDFGDFPLVRDSVTKTNPFLIPQMIEVNSLVAMVYVAKDSGDLRMVYGPNEAKVASIRSQLAVKEAAIEGVSVFNGADFKLDYGQVTYGKVAGSGLSVSKSSDSDFVAVFVTDTDYFLKVQFNVTARSLKSAVVTVLRAPTATTPKLCDPIIAYDPTHQVYAVIASVCGPGGLLMSVDPNSGALKPMGEKADYRVAGDFDLQGDFYLFGSRHPTAQLPHLYCSGAVSALFSHRYDSKLNSLEKPKWVAKDLGTCPYTLGAMGAVFDPSPLRSTAGRFYVFLTGGSEGQKRDMWTYHFDIAAQSNEKMATKIAHVNGPLFAWDPPVDQYGVGQVATGIYYKGRAILIAPTDAEKNEGQKAKHGLVLFSPSADAINRTAIEGSNDMVSLLARLPISITEMPWVDTRIRNRTPGDRDGDGTPDKLDNCPDHYNRPSQKNSAGVLIGDQLGVECQ